MKVEILGPQHRAQSTVCRALDEISAGNPRERLAYREYTENDSQENKVELITATGLSSSHQCEKVCSFSLRFEKQVPNRNPYPGAFTSRSVNASYSAMD